MIAMALALGPVLLIADEPTTALDVTVQAQIMELLEERARSQGTALLLITHDLGIVGERADEIAVMYAGEIVEKGPAQEVLRSPRHHYTAGLLECLPRGSARSGRLTTDSWVAPRPRETDSRLLLRFACRAATEICLKQKPRFQGSPEGRVFSCHHPIAAG